MSASPQEFNKIFNDPIHGQVELHPLCVKIIDTVQFQRLRNIKQLGACYFVFPGASHNRFEHCIGVCYLAGVLAKQLKSRQPDLGITEEDILSVEIAGLCHDLGHGPFSHLFDGKFIPAVRPDIVYHHEEASRNMFDHLVESNELEPVFAQYRLSKGDMTFIRELIAGPVQGISSDKQDWPYAGRGLEKSFLYEIVANKRNGIDVDKWDYFARDCHQLGISNNFDHMRFIKFVRVLDVEGQMQICSRDKEVFNLYDMFYTRNTLHRRAYQHKTSAIIEHMIVEALIKANEYIKIPGKDGKLLKMSECIDDMEAFTKLTDHVFYMIMQDPALSEASAILHQVERRDLYKCIGQTNPKQGVSIAKKDFPKLSTEIAAIAEVELGCDPLDPQDIIVHVVRMDYGMKEDNPINHVRFYRKSNLNKAIQVTKDQVSQMLPETFAEQHVRVYCKKADKLSLDVATKCFNRWCSKRDMVPKGEDKLSIELTPVKSSQSDDIAP